MIATGAIACANARVRALKSRLLGREIAGRAAAGVAPTARPDQDFAELLGWYHVVLKSYPRGHALVHALVRLHEIENVKLAWRAVINQLDRDRWSERWIALGRLATVRPEACIDCHTLPALVEALASTPYAEIARAMWRAHPHDGLAAEIGFDRWSSRAVIDAAAALPSADATAAALAAAIVRERDLNVMRRSHTSGLSADILAGALSYVPREIPLDGISRLAEWTPDRGPFWAAVPKRWQHRAQPVPDWDRWMVAWRRARRALCRRAFLESPFCLAPAVALLLLKEEEVRGLAALAVTAGTAVDAASLDYALAAGEMGA